jgi:heme-degrading monooxygenase HmoA
MLITVFRARLKPGLRDEYTAAVDRMSELARTMPGYISHKSFYAEDGERCTIVEFEHEEGLRTWRTNPEHLVAQRMARQKYYTPSTACRFARSIVNRNSNCQSRRRRRLDRRRPKPH